MGKTEKKEINKEREKITGGSAKCIREKTSRAWTERVRDGDFGEAGELGLRLE